MSFVPVGVRFWTTATVVLSLAALGYGLGADGEPFGKFVLGAAAMGAFLVTLFLVGVRDGTVAPVAARVGEGDGDAEQAEHEAAVLPPPPVPPTAPAFWPVVAALAGGIALVGLVASTALVWVGCALGAVVAIEWMVQGWAEHATPDPEENRELRNRLMYPFEIPAIAAAGVAVAVVGFSRVLLALPESGSTFIAIAVAALILAVASLVATRPRIGPGLVAVLTVLGGAALLAGGIAGAVIGERDIHPHEEGHGEGIVVVAEDIAFDTDEIEVPAGDEVSVTLVNEDDGTPHNIAFVGLPDSPATAIHAGPAEDTVSFTAEEAGEYEYLCEVHPAQMQGTLVVTDDAE